MYNCVLEFILFLVIKDYAFIINKIQDAYSPDWT